MTRFDARLSGFRPVESDDEEGRVRDDISETEPDHVGVDVDLTPERLAALQKYDEWVGNEDCNAGNHQLGGSGLDQDDATIPDSLPSGFLDHGTENENTREDRDGSDSSAIEPGDGGNRDDAEAEETRKTRRRTAFACQPPWQVDRQSRLSTRNRGRS